MNLINDSVSKKQKIRNYYILVKRTVHRFYMRVHWSILWCDGARGNVKGAVGPHRYTKKIHHKGHRDRNNEQRIKQTVFLK